MYIPCYIISLDHEVEKRDKLINELNKRGVVPHHYSAIYGKKLDKNLYPYTPRGVLGCAMSHVGVAQEFLKTEYNYCLILEDDAVPLFDEAEDLNQVVREAPPDMDSLLLYCMMYCFDKMVAKTMKTKYYKSSFPVSGAAYILSRRGAEIQSKIKPYFHIDFLRQQSNMNIYSIEPAMFNSPTSSDTSHTRSSINLDMLKVKKFDGDLGLDEVVKFKVLRLPFMGGTEIDTLTLVAMIICVIIALSGLIIYYWRLTRKGSTTTLLDRHGDDFTDSEADFN
jgi:hypothetical protein